jgi:magnesium chelatase family protein
MPSRITPPSVNWHWTGRSALPGTLPAAIGADMIGKGLICPAASGPEAVWASEDIDILAAPHLLSLINHFKGMQTLARPKPNVLPAQSYAADLRDIKGQETAKRALEIAAAGNHNLLMIGPPGSGKSMLASRLPSILPPLQPEEILEVSMVHSLAGELMGGKLTVERPFRAPHHSASMASLVGGGSRPRPGEVSLAHHGVLFLDELPEFQPNVLDALRQPLEAGETVIARANHRISYPSRIQLIAAMNPCKCGGGNPGEPCRRGPRCAADYQARVSGPLLDRIDLQIEVPAISAADLVLPAPTEGSAEVRVRVAAARERQRARFVALGAKGVRTIADCSATLLEQTAMPDEAGVTMLRHAAETLGLSARGFHRTLKVARTIADLESSETVSRAHIAEALSYRGRRCARRARHRNQKRWSEAMEFPESSAIQAADYDPEGRKLDVTFTSGRRYTYFSVPDWEFDGLVTATSAGEYSNTRIRDQYACKERHT